MKHAVIGNILIAAALLWSYTPPALGLEEAGNAARFHDWKDHGCRMSPGRPGMPSSGANNSGGNRVECPTCPDPEGQVRWWIDQPEVNLWLVDQPLSYFDSAGEKVSFRWYHRQRYTVPEIDECPTLYGIQGRLLSGLNPYAAYMRTYGMTNASWSHNWMMNLLIWSRSWENLLTPSHRAQTPVFSMGYEALVFRPEGGVYYFGVGTNGPGRLTDALSRVGLQHRSSFSYPVVSDDNNPPQPDATGVYWGDAGMGFTLVYPDGSQDVFGLAFYQRYSISLPDSTARAFLTQRIDPQGRTTWVGYEKITYEHWGVPSYQAYRVRYVVDADHRTNTFVYNSSEAAEHAWELAEITDPYGRKAQFGYSGGILYSMTDAATNTSYFSYEGPSGWLASLATPYGTTSFKYYQVPYTNVPNGYSKRAAYVTEPEGAHQLFYYLHRTNKNSWYCWKWSDAAHQLFYYLHRTNVLATTATAPTVTGQTFDDGTAGTEFYTLDYRNSFHWDRLQFAALSSSVTNQLASNLTNALESLTAQDFRKGRLKHWLVGANGLSISESLSSEQEPSPDAQGQINGLRTWYNYISKPSREREGAAEISCAARLLPDGTSHYTSYSDYGLQWENVSSSSAGPVTNYFTYALNGIDLASVSNSLGQTVTLGYTNHLVRSATNALNQASVYVWNTNTWQLLRVTNRAARAPC